MIAWKPISSFDVDKIVGARIQLHYAVQVVATAAEELLAPTDDHSHTTLRYEWQQAALYSLAITTEQMEVRRFCLRFDDFALAITDEHDRAIESFQLDGKTITEALSWVDEMIRTWIEPDHTLARTKVAGLTTHRLAEGGAFAKPGASELATLRDCFHNALLVLDRVGAGRSEASVVRVWPHHFDAAVLFSYSDPDEIDNPVAINLGMTPGDDTIAVPYFYVAPWPPPPAERLPYSAPPGAWFSEPWFGAALKLGEIADADADRQRELVEDFLRDGLEIAEQLLLA